MALSPFAARQASPDTPAPARSDMTVAREAITVLAGMVKSPAAQNALKVVEADILGHDNSKGSTMTRPEPSMRGTPGSQIQ